MGICNCKNYYQIHKLNKFTNNIPLFSFENKHCYAKILCILNNIFTVCMYHHNKIIKINCCLLGGQNEHGINIQDREKQWFEELTDYKNKLVYIQCHKYDSHGNVLITVYNHYVLYYKNKATKKSINTIIIEKQNGSLLTTDPTT